MAEEARPQYSTMIRDMPHRERPRERLRELGSGSLSNAELIAILLRTGVGEQGVPSFRETSLHFRARALSRRDPAE